MMSWIASVYECRLCTTLTWSDLQPGLYNFVRSASSLSLMVGPRIRRCCTVGIQLEPSLLRLPTLHSGSSPALPFAYQKFEFWSTCANSKCTCTYVYLRIRSFNLNFRYMAASRHTYIHTHASCNAVTLVWGSLRLALICEVACEVLGFEST